MASYLVGGQVRISVVFTVSGTATDPTAVSVLVKTPSDVTTTYVYGVDAEVVKTATGSYYIDQNLSEPGTWAVAMVGTGAVVAVDERAFSVRARLVS